VNRLVILVERLAGLFLGLVAAITFVSVVLRYFFNIGVPDWFAFAAAFQAVAIFWGMASTTYRGSHIAVDVLWEALRPPARRRLDILATAISAVFVVLWAWMLSRKVLQDMTSSTEVTSDLRVPVWIFAVTAAVGIVLTAVLVLLRLYELIRARPAVDR
jgi:TRAP-type C4-dicarboxylate transport system permease small subunit